LNHKRPSLSGAGMLGRSWAGSPTSDNGREEILLTQSATTSRGNDDMAELSAPDVTLQGTMPSDDDQCRLCLEEGNEELIAPCDCRGSARWVHRSCLNQWRYLGQNTNPTAMSHCPTCKYEYELYSTFNAAEHSRRRKTYKHKLIGWSVLIFVILQAALFLLAMLIRCVDPGERILQVFSAADQDPFSLKRRFTRYFFAHQIFYYYCAAFAAFLSFWDLYGVAGVSVIVVDMESFESHIFRAEGNTRDGVKDVVLRVIFMTHHVQCVGCGAIRMLWIAPFAHARGRGSQC